MRLSTKHTLKIELLQILTAIVSLVTATIALISYYKQKEYFELSLIIAFLLTTCMLIFICINYWNKANTRYQSNNAAFHEFNHRLRNEVYELRLLASQGKLTSGTLTANVKKTGEFSVNLLANLLTEITGEDISVHIKTFPIDTPKPNSYRTLCICSKTDPRRLTINDHPLNENTHFKRIVEGVEPHFFSDNFAKTIKDYKKATGRKFSITAENWEDWFQSIIVVPIRIESHLKGVADGTVYDYIGFICCDGKSAGSFRIKDMDAHLHLVKSFADGLYIYLDRIREYLSKQKNTL
jgi:hypothetical protein